MIEEEFKPEAITLYYQCFKKGIKIGH